MRTRPLLKICGLTRQADLDCALANGVDYCGFIFHPKSPRYIDPRAAANLDSGSTRRVGVFVNQGVEEIAAVAREARLDFIQLHGAQTAAMAKELGPERIIRVLWPKRFADPDELNREMERFADSCAFFLLDAGESGGGHGQTLDWRALAAIRPPRPWFLAGGLNERNLKEALTVLAPDGADLNSGVELSPGVKDHRKIAAAAATLADF